MKRAWFVQMGGKRAGPLTSRQLAAIARSGELKPNDLVWAEDIPKGPARRIRGLFEKTGAPTAAPPQVAPAGSVRRTPEPRVDIDPPRPRDAKPAGRRDLLGAIVRWKVLVPAACVVVALSVAVFMSRVGTKPSSCLDEAALALSESERTLVADLAERAKTGDLRGASSQIAALGRSNNAFALQQSAWNTGLLLAISDTDPGEPSWDTIRVAIEKTAGCPDARAAWLWVRAIVELRRLNDRATAARTMNEALQTLRNAGDHEASTRQLAQLVNLFNLAAYDRRLVAPTVEAWRMACKDAGFLANPDHGVFHVAAAIALEMQGDAQEAGKALGLVDPAHAKGTQVTALAIAFYLHGDAPTGKRLMQSAIAAGAMTPSPAWEETFAMPDAEAVKRVRGELMPDHAGP